MAPANWPTAYPFKYYPQGHRPSPVPDYESCLLSPEPSDACFATTPPTYLGTFFFDVLILDRRSSLESNNVIFDSVGASLFNTAEFDLDVEAGVRLGFIWSSPCGNDWIGEYFTVHNYQDAVTLSDPGGVVDVFFGQLGAPLPSITVEYESDLDSAELSVRTRQLRRVAPLAGFRYIQLDENFNSMQDAVNRQGWYSNADNDLFGFQFGLQALLLERGPVRFESSVKAGPFFNDVDVHVMLNPPGQTDFEEKHAGLSHTAFMGEVRLGLACRLGRRMNFRLGYHLLWLSGVALAPNQTDNVSFATNLEAVDLGDVLYQGGYAGFDLSW
jgi:hypothetical protein